MKRFILIAIEIVLCYVLQTSLYPYVSLANIMPNLLLILVVTEAYIHGRMTGLIVGLFCGLISDLCYGNLIGLYTIIYMLIGFYNGYANKIYAEEDYIFPLLFIGASDLVFNIFYYLFNFLLRGRLNLFFYFRRIMVPEVIYTIFASVIFYKLFQWLDALVEHRRKVED